jgi:hypothetical protein
MTPSLTEAQILLLGVGGSGAASTATITLDLSNCPDTTLSADKLTATNADFGAAPRICRSIASAGSGLYYIEATNTGPSASGVGLGIINSTASLTLDIWTTANGIGSPSNDPGIYTSGSSVGSTDGTWNTTGAGVDMALDLTNRKIWFRLRGGSLWNNSGTANPATNTGGLNLPSGLASGAVYVAVETFKNSPQDQITINFGATPFADTPPVGFGNFHNV